MEIVDALEHVFDHAQQIVAGVRPDQMEDPTPCTEWNVRALLGHMIGVVRGIGASARGEPRPEGPTAPADFGDDPAGSFRQAADANLAAWRRPDVMEETVQSRVGPMPGRTLAGINLVDTYVHSWDLARATGQDAALDADIATLCLEIARRVVSPEVRRGPGFADEVAVPAEAPAAERLVAFLGRQP